METEPQNKTLQEQLDSANATINTLQRTLLQSAHANLLQTIQTTIESYNVGTPIYDELIAQYISDPDADLKPAQPNTPATHPGLSMRGVIKPSDIRKKRTA